MMIIWEQNKINCVLRIVLRKNTPRKECETLTLTLSKPFCPLFFSLCCWLPESNLLFSFFVFLHQLPRQHPIPLSLLHLSTLAAPDDPPLLSLPASSLHIGCPRWLPASTHLVSTSHVGCPNIPHLSFLTMCLLLMSVSPTSRTPLLSPHYPGHPGLSLSLQAQESLIPSLLIINRNPRLHSLVGCMATQTMITSSLLAKIKFHLGHHPSWSFNLTEERRYKSTWIGSSPAPQRMLIHN